MAAVRHLELKKIYLVTWLLSSSQAAVVYQISSKSDDFSSRYGNFTNSRRRMFDISNFRGPIMGSLKSPCGTYYRSSILHIFEKLAFFGDRQTDEQMDRTNAQRRSWCCLNKRDHNCVVVCPQPRDGGAEASQHEKELYNKLLQSYSKHVRPVKRYTEPVRVRVAFSLVEVLSIDEDNGQLSVKAWLTMASRLRSLFSNYSQPFTTAR